MRLFREVFVKESRARGLLSILRQGFNSLVQSCLIVFITHVVYVMARSYKCCLLISKQCTRVLDYPRNSSMSWVGYNLWSSVLTDGL